MTSHMDALSDLDYMHVVRLLKEAGICTFAYASHSPMYTTPLTIDMKIQNYCHFFIIIVFFNVLIKYMVAYLFIQSDMHFTFHSVNVLGV